MTTPKLAYCAQKGRVTDGANGYGGADEAITAETFNKYTRLGRRLRAEAFVDVFATVGRGLAKPFRAIGAYQSKRKAMRQLRTLPNSMLKDIGIGRSDITAVVEELWAPGRLPNEYRVLDAAESSEAADERILKKAA